MMIDNKKSLRQKIDNWENKIIEKQVKKRWLQIYDRPIIFFPILIFVILFFVYLYLTNNLGLSGVWLGILIGILIWELYGWNARKVYRDEHKINFE